MNKKFYATLFFATGFIFSIRSNAQTPSITYEVVSAITGLSAPVDIVNAGDGSNRLFIVQQNGVVRVWNGSTLSVFMNIGPTGPADSIATAGGEEGLLSLAFHPGYNGTTNRYFFVYYTNNNGDLSVTRFQTTEGNPNPITADLTTGKVVIVIPHPSNNNHNGAKLNFGPDNYLYFATGDGGGGNDVPNNAQTGTSLLGKMIRIDINDTITTTYGNYDVPADNPYVSDGSVDDRIWALGLRNPFRWSFDRANGNMWIGDVGQGAQEEFSFQARAVSPGPGNFGWRCYEGHQSTPGVTDCHPANNIFPVFDYVSGPGSASAVGGYVYRGNEYAFFRGYYIGADVYLNDTYILFPNGSGGFDSLTLDNPSGQNTIVSFGEAEDGTLYATSLATNQIYKVVPGGFTALPVRFLSFSVRDLGIYNELKWTTATENNTSRFHIEFSRTTNGFQRAGEVRASRDPNGSNYSFQHNYNSDDVLFYRLAIEDDNGRVNHSPIIKLSSTGKNGIKIYPSVVRNGIINIETDRPVNKLQLVNMSGAVVFQKDLTGVSGTTAIQLPQLAKGMYFAQVIGNFEVIKEKVLIE